MQKILHYINIALNVAPHEWPRIILSWFLKLFAHAGMIMGSTILLALFVEQYGINKLPFLYISSALFVVFGSLAFAFVIERFTKKYEIILTTAFAGALLYFAPLFAETTMVFYLMMFSALSIFVTQLNIIIALFIEELFSPLESERTFPIIESSEPIGGILAGLILTVGVTKFHLSALDLLTYVAGFLGLIIPFLIISLKISNKIPKLEHSSEVEEHRVNRVEKTIKGLRHIKGMPFLKGMVVVVFLQFAFINLIEFQYTTILEENISHGNDGHAVVEEVEAPHAAAPVIDNHGHNNHKENTEHKAANSHTEEIHGAAGGDHSHADALTHGLAFWHVMFSLLAFIVQTITASRIHNKLGIVKSMRMHPLATMLTSLTMLFKFSFAPVIAARGIFEITTIMHRTAYHASYYALKKSIREHVKEFLEGIIRPLGTIAGTTLLFGILYYIPEEFNHAAISLMMVIIMGTMMTVLARMKSQYTLIAKKNLDSRTSNIEKLEAIEILAQKGHDDVSIILGKNIHDRQHVQIQCKILETLGNLKDIDSIPDILKSFEVKERKVQLQAAQALAQFPNLGQHFFSQSFAKHRVISALESLFLKSRSKKVKSAVIQVFQNINNADIIPFLLKVLDNKDPEIVADAIYVCGLFNDANSAHYIEKYLFDEHPRIKSAAIISLWNFPQHRLKCLIQLTQMLSCKDDEMKISGIYAVGEIKAVQELPRLKKLLQSENERVQCHAAIAMAKMGELNAAHLVVNFLMHSNKKLSDTTHKLITRLPGHIKKTVKHLLRHRVSHKIHMVLISYKHNTLDQLPIEVLRELQKYYEVLGEMKEVLKIEEELERRQS